MHVSAKLAAAAVVAALVPASGAEAGERAPTCASGGAKSAAVELFGPGTELVRVGKVAGLRTALVSEPRIAPGTRRRMVRAGGRWCEAASGFNRAWSASGRSVGDGRAMAKAYARLAAAPYFDGVRVESVDAGAAGAWVLRTHARTNGVVARWVIVTDARGIRAATWTATEFARKPFVASWEGLTALPGATERYVRLAGGRLNDVRGLPTAATSRTRADDGDVGTLEHTFDDGFKIVTSIGDSHVGVDIGTDTGVAQVDVLRATMRAARENYEEFRSWGLEKGWIGLPGLSDDVGYVYVNDALTAYCLACVFNSDDFQIHLLSEFQTALDLLGYDGYRDRAQAFSLVLGHEMFHNFQNRYNRPGHFNTAGRATPTSYSEGTARFQETLHTYAGTTFAPRTLITANNTNGCNGFDTGGSMDNGMAAGPFGKTYNTCFFWGPWYVAHGKEAFLDLVREAMPAHSAGTDAFVEIARAAEQAAGEPIADQLADFAAAAITGQGRAWTTWSGTQVNDWGSLWERWKPAAFQPGNATRTLGPGGVMAFELTQAGKVSVSGSQHARLYIVRDKAGTVHTRPVNGLAGDSGPIAEGEKAYAVVVRPVAGSEAVTLDAGKGEAPAYRPAQGPVTGTVVTEAPGVGARIDDVTSHYFTFEVPATADNARGEFVATYPQQADIDLYLHRLAADGTWTEVDSGGSSSMTGETMDTERLDAGSYRVEVHNWAGPPENEVTVTGTFFNTAGRPGR